MQNKEYYEEPFVALWWGRIMKRNCKNLIYAQIILVVLCFANSSFVYAGILNDYNPYNVSIPDDGPQVNSDLSLSGAPSGTVITKVKIYYEIRHTYPGDLDVWLTAYYDGGWHDYFLYHNGDLGGSDDIIETRDNLHTWDGASPNQTWYLTVRDRASGEVGYIDFFELWVTYQANNPPNTPSNEDPHDGDTGVPRNTNLDWSCSDPDGDTVYYTVYLEKNNSSPDNVIKNDATGSYADPGTLDYNSHYYWRVKADDHNGGVTWGPVWDFYTKPEPVIDAEIEVTSIKPNPLVPGNSITIYYTVTNTGNVSHSFGVGSEIRQGSTKKDDVGDEMTPTISPGSSNSGSFPYTIPSEWSGGTYTARCAVWTGTPGSSTWLDSHDRNFTVESQNVDADIEITSVKPDPVVAGNSITIYYTVTNIGNVSHSFGVGSEIWQGSTKKDDVGDEMTPTISPGFSNSGSFPYTIPSDWSEGTYTARCAVWTGTPGSSIWLDLYDRIFSIQVRPLVLNGRLVYHSYSDYMAPPVDSIDGNIFMYSFTSETLDNVTGSLAVDNAMNAHFSPDGSRITFMAVPKGSFRHRSSLEIYVYDFAESLLSRLTSNSVPDEDPKFSPDGRRIVFKLSGQIWIMDSDGQNKEQLTVSLREKSGPYFSPDGTRIAFWFDAKSTADIGWMLAHTNNSDTVLFGESNVQEMYPVFRDTDTILYSKWEYADSNPDPPNPPDDIYSYSISSGVETKLGRSEFNKVGVDDADAFPVGIIYVGYSSTRNISGGKGSYDIYVGNPETDSVYALPNMNSSHQDLGGWYSPYRYARKLKMIEPAVGVSLVGGESYLLKVIAYSDAGIWGGANPSVKFQGGSSQTYSSLKDDGTLGDEVPGDGVYSKLISICCGKQ